MKDRVEIPSRFCKKSLYYSS